MVVDPPARVRAGATAALRTILLTLLFAVQAAFAFPPTPAVASDAQIVSASRARLLAVRAQDGSKLVQLVSRGTAAHPDVRGDGGPPLPSLALLLPRRGWSSREAIPLCRSHLPSRPARGDPHRARAPPLLG